MLRGAFFSEMGNNLLSSLACFDRESEEIIRELELPEDWSEREFLNIRNKIHKQDYEIKASGDSFAGVKDFLLEKKQFVLDLLMNQNLIENESFSNLVWSVYHLTE